MDETLRTILLYLFYVVYVALFFLFGHELGKVEKNIKDAFREVRETNAALLRRRKEIEKEERRNRR